MTDAGRARLSALGSWITRSNPAFDSRNYGVAKLGELIRQQAAYLDAKEVESGEGMRCRHICVCGGRLQGLNFRSRGKNWPLALVKYARAAIKSVAHCVAREARLKPQCACGWLPWACYTARPSQTRLPFFALAWRIAPTPFAVLSAWASDDFAEVV